MTLPEQSASGPDAAAELRDFGVTLTIRTVVQAATLRDALRMAEKRLEPAEFELRRFDIKGL